MGKVFLSFGFDDERPYGQLAKTPEGTTVRCNNLNAVTNIKWLFQKHQVPLTFFILGDYLKSCLLDFSINFLREMYPNDNPLIEIQQHSFSHPIFRKIAGREDKSIVTPEEFLQDVRHANEVIDWILGVNCTGIRTPLGYHTDLSDLPEIVIGLESMGFKYVSSNLRSERSLEAPLTLDRQPHDYSGAVLGEELVEIPSHGWQDAAFVKEKFPKYFKMKPSQKEIAAHYINLIHKAKLLAENSKDYDGPVFISLCLHPWAVAENDPDLFILNAIISAALQNGVEIIKYGDILKHMQKKV